MSLVKYIEQRRLEKEREVRRKIRKEKLTSAAKIAAGVAVGAGVGILFAPKSGKETREDIVKATKEGVGYVSENVKEAVGEKYDNFANRNMTEISPEVDEIDVTEIAETTEE